MNLFAGLISAFLFFPKERVASNDVKPYTISRIDLADQRILRALTDYMNGDDLTDLEGAVILKYDRETTDTFFVGYAVSKSVLRGNPPSFYSFVNGKLVLIYTGLEKYLDYKSTSFKLIDRDSRQSFSAGMVILEPTYWAIMLTTDGYERRTIDKLRY